MIFVGERVACHPIILLPLLHQPVRHESPIMKEAVTKLKAQLRSVCSEHCWNSDLAWHCMATSALILPEALIEHAKAL